MIRTTAPPPPPPRFERRWDVVNTVLAATGGAALITGGVVFAVGAATRDDTAGTLSDYMRRLERADRRQWIGGVIGTAGALLASAAIVRWRVRRVEVAPIQPGVSNSAVGLAAEVRW